MHSLETLQEKGVELLKNLIKTRSLSKEEDDTARLLVDFLKENGIFSEQDKNNVWAKNEFYDESRPTILLNSHHDTVKPNPGYTRDPFSPDVENGKLYGLGSNDAGGCLVSLLMTFLYFYNKKDLKYNFIFAASAEEEISGPNGMEYLFPRLPKIDFAIVGEPTLMDAAVAEKGLMVVDCIAKGKSGHAAREEGINAIYKAAEDILFIKNYQFPKVSQFLGPVKLSVCIINAGSQHNVVPDRCEYVLDIRSTDEYSNEEIVEILQEHLHAELKPRSFRLKPSFIDPEHPFIQACISQGAKTYGSPTTSDQAVIGATSVKMGPGDSARSHMSDEYIYVEEVHEGIQKYISALESIV